MSLRVKVNAVLAILLVISLHADVGLHISIPGSGQRLVKARLLCTVMDLPALAAMLNCKQYNGKHGCSTCKHPGCTVSSS